MLSGRPQLMCISLYFVYSSPSPLPGPPAGTWLQNHKGDSYTEAELPERQLMPFNSPPATPFVVPIHSLNRLLSWIPLKASICSLTSVIKVDWLVTFSQLFQLHSRRSLLQFLPYSNSCNKSFIHIIHIVALFP